MNKKQLRKRRNEVVDIKIRYCPVTFNEIPRFARNDKAFVVFADVSEWVGGIAANPFTNIGFYILNSLSF